LSIFVPSVDFLVDRVDFFNDSGNFFNVNVVNDNR
jgi:hypothetical protein